MKYLGSILILMILLGNVGIAQAAPSPSPIHWETNYDAALCQARERHQPLLVFFTGSDWCSWCHKLEDEVLNQREFANAMRGRFLFVRLDFPMNRKLPQAERNQQLSTRYEIKSFPTVLLIDEQERVIGRTGYQAGGVQNFVNHLNQLMQ